MEIPDWVSGAGLLGLASFFTIKGLLEMPPEMYEEAGVIAGIVTLVIALVAYSVISSSNRYR